MEYNPEQIVKAYEDRLMRESLRVGKQQIELLEEVLKELAKSRTTQSAPDLSGKIGISLPKDSRAETRKHNRPY